MLRYVTRYLTSTLLASVLAVITLTNANAQPDGAALFKANCTSCHTTGTNKVVGPGLKDIHTKRSEEWLISWIRNSQAMIKAGDPEAVKIFEEYNKTAMPAFGFSDDEMKAIIGYIKTESEKAPAAPAGGGAVADGKNVNDPGDSNNPVLLITIVLILAALYYILNRVKKGLEKVQRHREGIPEPVVLKGKAGFKHKLRENKKLFAVLLVIGMTWGSVAGWNALAKIGVQQGYMPDQPIKFSHKLHVGQNKIDCRYCHNGAEKSKNAGIPSVNVCMNCHKYVQEGPKYGKDEIAKIYEAIDWDPDKGVYGNNQKPIEWVRIHNLPDFAYFNHSQHVNVAGLDCQNCHGPVGEMEVMYQFSPLTMGWCVDCHRTTEVKADNGYYKQLHDDMKKIHGPEVKLTVDKLGGLECARCHY